MAPTSTHPAISARDTATSHVRLEAGPDRSLPSKLCRLWRQYGPPAWRRQEKKPKMTVVLRECVACMEMHDEMKMAVLRKHDCEHAYCSDCFKTLVEVACRSEGSFPPRCCGQTIPCPLVKAKVSKRVMQKYQDMSILCLMPPNKRWYCPHPRCGVLQWDHGADSWYDVRAMKCHRCRGRICPKCKKEIRMNRLQVHICEETAELDEEVRKLVQGWKSCPRCGYLIDVDTGCRHAVCLCGHEFCYECMRAYSKKGTGMESTCVDVPSCVKNFRHRKARARKVSEQAQVDVTAEDDEDEDDPLLDLPDDEEVLQQIEALGADAQLIQALLDSRSDERRRQLDILRDTRRQGFRVVNNTSTPRQL
jgi:hypothetical protein